MLVDIQFLDNLRGAKNNYSFSNPPKIRELGALVSGYDHGEIRGLSVKGRRLSSPFGRLSKRKFS